MLAFGRMHPVSTHASEATLYDRLTILSRIPHSIYAHGIAWLSEFVGTTFFLFLALSGEQIAYSMVRSGDPVVVLLYASLSYALAFAVSSWVFFRVTPGLFNPAITLGMCFIGSISWLRAIFVILAQFIGAMTAAGLVDAIFPGPLVPTMGLSSGTPVVRGFFIEFFLTMCFVLMVFMMACEKHKGIQFIAPIGLGLALCSVELSSILFTGGSLNPARAFAVALASHHWPGYHWIYWIAPFLGCVPAGLIFNFIKLLERETSAAQHRTVEAVIPVEQSVAIPSTRPSGSLSAIQEQDVEKGHPEVVKP